MASHPVRALVGARVSHVQGAEKTSHLTQHKTGDKYADSAGWVVVGTFEDLDVSAIKTTPWQRPDLRPWLTERSHEWDALILAKTDRLFRSAKDCIDLSHWAEQNHKILVFVDDGLKLDFHTPEADQDPFSLMMTRIFLILASVFAEIEGRRFVQRAQSRTRFLRQTDRWSHGSPRFGFRVVDHPSGVGKALDYEPAEQAVLHDIARRFLEGKPIGTIVAELTTEGVMPSRDMRRVARGEAPKGERWSHHKVEVLLTSPSTQGIKVAGDRPVLDEQGRAIRVGPPSFDPETWADIQRRMAEAPRLPREHSHGSNPMLGVGFCSCGANLRHQAYYRNGHYRRYYRCNRGPRPCPGVAIRAADAEGTIEEEFLRELGDEPALVRVFDPGEDTSYELSEVEETIAALREDRALGLFTSKEDQALFRSQIGALVARRDELQSRAVRPAGYTLVETGRTYRDAWAAADIVGRRKLLVDAGIRLTLSGPREATVSIPEDIREHMRRSSSRQPSVDGLADGSGKDIPEEG